MKKFILPFLSAVVLLSSCSQALYKNKYDWVKADRSVQHTECDPEKKEDKPAGTEWVRVIAVILTFGLLLAFGWVALGPVGLLLVILGILAVLVAVLIVLSIVLGILFDFGATIVQSYSETH